MSSTCLAASSSPSSTAVGDKRTLQDYDPEKASSPATPQQSRPSASPHHPSDAQPTPPSLPKRSAHPAPLGILSFATSLFLLSAFGVHTRSIAHPNAILGCLIFFGGLCQFLTGIVHLFRAGGGAHSDTFAATVFPSYGAFNLAYALIYLPGSGILAAYTDDPANPGAAVLPTREFYDAMGVWYWAWFIVTVIFLIGAVRTNWVVVSMLGLLALELAMLAVGSMMGGQGMLNMLGSGVGFVVSGLAYYAGAASLWGNGATPIKLPLFPMRRQDDDRQLA
ncbi:MAG: hypothetical protein OHK93_000783 [Ramalina farinacea]|uniref:Uncharacterized protein n=1 Tax=Ramalina farinacea TaxID=258253 RepID=A0AA43TS91_9LECA|nr:hypothetical protein [Ramalina farinacea]